MTHQALAKTWYWRSETAAYYFKAKEGGYVTVAKPGAAGETWKKNERAIHWYEHARRELLISKSQGHEIPSKPSLVSFPELNPRAQEIILDIFAGPEPDEAPDGSATRLPLEFSVETKCEHDWSARRSVREFMQGWDAHHRPFKTKKRRGPTGKKNRSPSWRRVELLDIAEAQSKELIAYPRFNASERKLYSLALIYARRGAIWMRSVAEMGATTALPFQQRFRENFMRIVLLQ
ncbi:MAG TPA: hypothetical protein VNT99_00460 [Methylomirabilota bacterium]|nr:hypothetical protein [Methylomirabilota bacterium]